MSLAWGRASTDLEANVGPSAGWQKWLALGNWLHGMDVEADDIVEEVGLFPSFALGCSDKVCEGRG